MRAKPKRPTGFDRTTFEEGGRRAAQWKVDLVFAFLATSPCMSREGVSKYLKILISSEVWDEVSRKRKTVELGWKQRHGWSASPDRRRNASDAE